MKNYTFGYARVSTEAQNLDRQIDALRKYGCDIIYSEKMTGTKKDRPELNKMIELTELFQSKGVHLVSMKENIDTSTPSGKLLFTLMSAIAQFERDTIADRTCEGLRAARARGRTGGRPKTNPDTVKKAVKLYQTGQYSVKEVEEMTGIKKSTLYRNLKMSTKEKR